MPSPTQGLPFGLGRAESALSRYDRSDFAADYAIGTLPWLSAATDDNRISRVTTQFQKDRLDQAALAGEQSLSNWWLRSATSWHRGAGITYYDADDTDLHRFADSYNMDVWTEGSASLLAATTNPHAMAASSPEACTNGTWFISDGNVYCYEEDGDVVDVTAFAGSPHVLTTDGSSAFVGAADGIYKITSAYASTRIYNAPGGAWTVQSIGYVKDRLIVCAQITDAQPMRVFELGRNPSSATISLTDDSVWEFDSTTLSFKGVAELTAAILVGCVVGTKSTVLSFGLDTSVAGVVSLKEPITVAGFPVGETLQALRTYLNSYVVVGTSQGLRIGTETTNGLGFTYGPLVVRDSVVGLAFGGEYVYATRSALKGAVKGLWRVNLGEAVGSSYAYAPDLSTSVSEPTGVALIGNTGRLLITSGDGIWAESATVTAAAGELTSGKIRFGTTEAKQLVSMMTRVDGDTGSATVAVSGSAGQFTSFLRSGEGIEQTDLSVAASPDPEFEITLTFSRGGSSDPGPTIEEWQIRALPAPQRSRTITLPLQCRPEETDALGNTRYSNAFERLQALEYLESIGGSVLLQDFSTGEERTCVIRAIQYDQPSPPSFVGGFSGVVIVQLQTVDTENQ